MVPVRPQLAPKRADSYKKNKLNSSGSRFCLQLVPFHFFPHVVMQPRRPLPETEPDSAVGSQIFSLQNVKLNRFHFFFQYPTSGILLKEHERNQQTQLLQNSSSCPLLPLKNVAGFVYELEAQINNKTRLTNLVI